ncbi:uncharacterized protein B0I36DRAFT_363698 [Microdochium trichocladiopsis]|uniref:Uncharacterized protein n=1 Tax=Microdochium trichocladiopsis TaxID=1682393 RepID=A0A9P9BPH8_9PEZI|nr:uncharacterized protein B0I36DRAFT_363698 [Microdochium trichocladiopsis]KAH7029110.1 hypothetical protein B0I36DRAFT_363698 [Microdochium trichocladiopsis]
MYAIVSKAFKAGMAVGLARGVLAMPPPTTLSQHTETEVVSTMAYHSVYPMPSVEVSDIFSIQTQTDVDTILVPSPLIPGPIITTGLPPLNSTPAFEMVISGNDSARAAALWEEHPELDSSNYCDLAHKVLWKSWKIIAKSVPGELVPHVCHDLWDGLKDDIWCAAPIYVWCGPGRGDQGLEWSFATSSFCRRASVDHAWFSATRNEYGRMHCVPPK